MSTAAVAEWPATWLALSADEAVAALESAPRRALSAEDRIKVALHCLAGQDGDLPPLVRILADRALSDENAALWWETYRTAVRACDAIALDGGAWQEFYDADDLTGGRGLSNAEAAEQMAAQDADEALTVLTGGAR